LEQHLERRRLVSLSRAEPRWGQCPDYAVPARRDDLAGLPPAWIRAGDVELFYDEDRRYAERLSAPGVPRTFEAPPPGAPHAFESFLGGTPVGKAYLAAAETLLARQLAVPPPAD
jgi:acetyl esterase/lipase